MGALEGGAGRCPVGEKASQSMRERLRLKATSPSVQTSELTTTTLTARSLLAPPLQSAALNSKEDLGPTQKQVCPLFFDIPKHKARDQTYLKYEFKGQMTSSQDCAGSAEIKKFTDKELS